MHLRVEQAQSNAFQIAKFLEHHPMVERVLYPGLESYPQYEIAKKQARGPGAVISFYIKGGLPVAGKFLQVRCISSLESDGPSNLSLYRN